MAKKQLKKMGMRTKMKRKLSDISTHTDTQRSRLHMLRLKYSSR